MNYKIKGRVIWRSSSVLGLGIINLLKGRAVPAVFILPINLIKKMQGYGFVDAGLIHRVDPFFKFINKISWLQIDAYFHNHLKKTGKIPVDGMRTEQPWADTSNLLQVIS